MFVREAPRKPVQTAVEECRHGVVLELDHEETVQRRQIGASQAHRICSVASEVILVFPIGERAARARGVGPRNIVVWCRIDDLVVQVHGALHWDRLATGAHRNLRACLHGSEPVVAQSVVRAFEPMLWQSGAMFVLVAHARIVVEHSSLHPGMPSLLKVVVEILETLLYQRTPIGLVPAPFARVRKHMQRVPKYVIRVGSLRQSGDLSWVMVEELIGMSHQDPTAMAVELTDLLMDHLAQRLV
eukprot:CAMPEP_0119499234 /NCGR_PEP_ID=MMETSP1344-20130328/21755_1 /TAXON_ID=236787 /ORGANISM="Florenciella parvula, Strain CCMP2471" /LENGTH=242 /DNA_ID=CAMNT_0007535207 /DNA_START=229 /DNA_END=954 /DNA_ORIENTATION=+